MHVGRFFEIGQTTLERVTYNDWFTVNGLVSHDVMRLVTPAVAVSSSVL